MNECLWNQALLGENFVDCNDLFHHYKPQSPDKVQSKDVRVGSYNILRASEQKDRKNWDLTAEMIEAQWDLFSVQELQPGRTDDIINSHQKGAPYVVPAYLELLLKLQAKDKTWGLILSPYAQGSDSELLGFYYRGRMVEPVESAYCQSEYVQNPPYSHNFVYRAITASGIESSQDGKPISPRFYVLPQKAYACPLRLSGIANRNFVKVPLMARFKVGSFESAYISLHLSFRGIDEFDSRCMALCQLQNLKLISTLDGDRDNSIAQAINKLLAEKKTQDLILGTEIKIPNTDDRCQINDKKLKKDPALEQERYKYCIARLRDQVKLIKEKGFFPKSCHNVVENIADGDRYEKCINDYDDLRVSAYKNIVRDTFKRIIFKQYPKIAKKHGQTLKQFYKQAFAGDFIQGMYSVLGRDWLISLGEGRQFSRFFQVYSMMAAARQIRESEKTRDIIISGDFNLEKETEPNSWHYKIWQHSLKLIEADIYVSGLTSINFNQELVSNYDHFIFSPSETSECDEQSIHIFNYLKEKLNNGFDIPNVLKKEKYHFVMSDHLPIGMNCSGH